MSVQAPSRPGDVLTTFAGALEAVEGLIGCAADAADRPCDSAETLEDLAPALGFVDDETLRLMVCRGTELRARLQALSLAASVEACRRGLLAASGVDVSGWLIDRLLVPVPEAMPLVRLLRRAADLAQVPVVNDAITGAMTPAQALATAQSVDRVRHDIPEDVVGDVVAEARALGREGDTRPVRWRAFEEEMLARFGNAEDNEANGRCRRAKRELSAFTPRADGTYHGTMTLDPDSMAIINAAIEAMAAPAPRSETGVEGDASACCGESGDHVLGAGPCSHTSDGLGSPPVGASGDEVPRDRRSAGQRRLDALVQLCLIATGAQATGGMGAPTSVTLIVRAETLAGSAGSAGSAGESAGAGAASAAADDGPRQGESAAPGQTSGTTSAFGEPWAGMTEQMRGMPPLGIGLVDGGYPLSVASAQRLSCDAEIIPVIAGFSAEPFDVGRTKRLATPAQRTALALRDAGCTFPSCSAPVSWCRAHHIVHWALGGPTDLYNLALLCERHHVEVHQNGFMARADRQEVRWLIRRRGSGWERDDSDAGDGADGGTSAC